MFPGLPSEADSSGFALSSEKNEKPSYTGKPENPMNNTSNGFTVCMGSSNSMGCFMRRLVSNFWRKARWTCLALGIGLSFVGGETVVAQNPYPSPSTSYGAPAMPPTFPGGAGNVVAPLPGALDINQQQPGVSLPPA